MSIGKPTISKKPPTQQSYNRNRYGGRDRRGGGAIIPCQYKLYCKSPTACERVKAFVVSSLKELENYEGTEKVFEALKTQRSDEKDVLSGIKDRIKKEVKEENCF